MIKCHCFADWTIRHVVYGHKHVNMQTVGKSQVMRQLKHSKKYKRDRNDNELTFCTGSKVYSWLAKNLMMELKIKFINNPKVPK